MARFSEQAFGSANRFVSGNDHKANAPACHSQYKLIDAICIVALQTKAAGTSDAALKAFAGHTRWEILLDVTRENAKRVQEIKKLPLAI
jgi:hypothetical protein